MPRTKPLIWIVAVAIPLGVGLVIWKLYGDYASTSRTASLRAFIREEMNRSEKSRGEGTKFGPLACDLTCSNEFLARYSATDDGELKFMLRGHPEYTGKSVGYRLRKSDSPPGGKLVYGRCETDLEHPARSRFPNC